MFLGSLLSAGCCCRVWTTRLVRALSCATIAGAIVIMTIDIHRSSIGIVLHDFALGGTERIALRMANIWAASGRHVVIVCGSPRGALDGLACLDVEIVAASPTIERAPGSLRRLSLFAADCFRRHPVGTCFIPGNYHWSFIPPLIRLEPATRPLVVAQVSASLDKPQRGLLRQAAFDRRMRRLLHDADGVVTLCEAMQKAADRILRAPRSTIIPLPALDNVIKAPAPLPIASTVLAAGRLVPEKGFADLIDAFTILPRPDAQLVILGEGPQRQALLDRARRLGVESRVSLPGYVPDTRPWLDKARLFVISSRFEGYPAVMIEALAAGRPLVSTNCSPACEDLLTKSGFGITVPINDPFAMAVAIQRVLDQAHWDPAEMTAAVACHRIGPVANAYLDLFDRLARQRHVA